MKERRLPGDPQAMARKILGYLTESPDAKDTIEGILRWWLPKEMIEQRETVQEALDFLVSEGWVISRETDPSERIYGLNRERLEDVEVFLRDL